MQLKWLEDFVVLAQTRSFSRAAELRHVTHPAFGRRIRALEEWAGTPLLERQHTPLRLTAAGESLLEYAQHTSQTLAQARDALQQAAGRPSHTVTLATGRTLARTLVADWLRHVQPELQARQGAVVIRTLSLAGTQAMLERQEADFMLAYHHPLLAVQLSARQYLHRTLVLDRLVPGYYHRLDAQGQVERSTCCDNTATEHRMMGKLMEDSVLLWARAHHIDSFRFDLMGHQPRDAMVELADLGLPAG